MDTINNPFYCILSLLSVVPLEVILLYLLSYSLLWYSFGYFHSSLLVQFLHFSNFFCYGSFRQSIFSDLEIEIFFLVFLVFVFLFPEIPCDWGEMSETETLIQSPLFIDFMTFKWQVSARICGLQKKQNIKKPNNLITARGLTFDVKSCTWENEAIAGAAGATGTRQEVAF